jgi:hypothetical protein
MCGTWPSDAPKQRPPAAADKTMMRTKRTFGTSLSGFKGEERAKRTVDTSAAMSVRVGGMICKVREMDVDSTLAPANTRTGGM